MPVAGSHSSTPRAADSMRPDERNSALVLTRKSSSPPASRRRWWNRMPRSPAARVRVKPGAARSSSSRGTSAASTRFQPGSRASAAPRSETAPSMRAGRRIAREHGAAGPEESLEQVRGRGVQVLGHRREHDGPVLAAPDAQRGPVHGPVPGDDVLGPEVVFDLGRFDRDHEGLERLADPLELRGAPLAAVVHPGGRRRLEEQHVVHLLSCDIATDSRAK